MTEANSTPAEALTAQVDFIEAVNFIESDEIFPIPTYVTRSRLTDDGDPIECPEDGVVPDSGSKDT
jgi:hypothetical protein